jgi:hypothetical protein
VGNASTGCAPPSSKIHFRGEPPELCQKSGSTNVGNGYQFSAWGAFLRGGHVPALAISAASGAKRAEIGSTSPPLTVQPTRQLPGAFGLTGRVNGMEHPVAVIW